MIASTPLGINYTPNSLDGQIVFAIWFGVLFIIFWMFRGKNEIQMR
jgi:hypothetical protein